MKTFSTTTTRNFENGIIEGFNFKFTDIGGRQGQQFVLELNIKVKGGGYTVHTNPRKIPQLLKFLEIKSTNELVGTPIQIEKAELGELIPQYIKPFMSDGTIFPINEGNYFGSDLFIEYEDDLFRGTFLPEDEYNKKRPELGKTTYRCKTSDKECWKKHFQPPFEPGDTPPFDSGVR